MSEGRSCLGCCLNDHTQKWAMGDRRIAIVGVLSFVNEEGGKVKVHSCTEHSNIHS